MKKIINKQATYTVAVDQAVTFGAEKAVIAAVEHYNIKIKKKRKMTHSIGRLSHPVMQPLSCKEVFLRYIRDMVPV